MKLTHLLTLLVAAPSAYVLYQKLDHAPTESEPLVPAASTPVIAEPSAATVGLRQLKPADWVQGLPDQACSRYVEVRTSLRGNERVEATRAWMALWNQYLRDPNLTLVELDYIDLNIKNRSPLLYTTTVIQGRANAEMVLAKPPVLSDVGAWKREFQQRLSTIDSLDHMLRAIRARGVRHPALLEMIGETTDRITEERNKLAQYNRYFDDNRLR